MSDELIIAGDDAGELLRRDSGNMHTVTTVQWFHGNEAYDPDAEPYDVVEVDNLFMFGGSSFLWACAFGNGGSGALAYLTNSNCAIGVGDSTTAAAGTQTDLQATTNKLRKGMNATYPQHTDGVTNANRFSVFQSTFGSSEANFRWEEYGVFNALSGGRMLNRKVAFLGEKTSASSALLTVTFDIG